jgi:hypothetical protein
MHQKGKKCGKPVNMCIGVERRLTGGTEVHSGVSQPHFEASGHHCCCQVCSSKDVFLCWCFSFEWSSGHRLTPKCSLWSPTLTCWIVLQCGAPWYIQNVEMMNLGANRPPTLGPKCAEHRKQRNIKCRGPTGGNTLAEPKIHWFQLFRHKL